MVADHSTKMLQLFPIHLPATLTKARSITSLWRHSVTVGQHVCNGKLIRAWQSTFVKDTMNNNNKCLERLCQHFRFFFPCSQRSSFIKWSIPTDGRMDHCWLITTVVQVPKWLGASKAGFLSPLFQRGQGAPNHAMVTFQPRGGHCYKDKRPCFSYIELPTKPLCLLHEYRFIKSWGWRERGYQWRFFDSAL